MTMKETYLSRDFRETAVRCFPSQSKELNAFFDARLNVLLAENADAAQLMWLKLITVELYQEIIHRISLRHQVLPLQNQIKIPIFR